MDTNDSLQQGHSQLAVWQYFEGYNPSSEEFRRLADHFERLAANTTWSFDDVLQIDNQICRILERLNTKQHDSRS
jgi:predicted SprT family Zn-dependent metalloprotease